MFMGKDSFDVVIIGGGPAGISAALWCDELGLDALLVESGPGLGGQLNWTFNSIENYLGVNAAKGAELRDKFLEQLGKRKTEILLNSRVIEIDSKKQRIELEAGKAFNYKYLIVATGVRRRRLNVQGEREFEGRGVLFSGKRDRDLVKGKTVVVVGGGDAALENVKILSDVAEKVILVHRRKEFRARKEFIDFVDTSPMVTALAEKRVVRLIGEENLSSVEIVDVKTGEISQIETAAFLTRIGVTANSEIVAGFLNLTPQGYVIVDNIGETSVKNLFAIGDISNPIAPTVSTAVGAGAAVLKFISREIQKVV